MAIVPQAQAIPVHCPQECTTSSPSDCLDEAGILQIAATNITNGQFFNCPNIVTVNMSNVKTIGKTAFRLCNNLAEVYMPSVIEIGEMAFEECASLANVNMSNVKTIGKTAFRKCESLITVDMPSVIEIGEMAFEECESLITVDMPSVLNISKEAFRECESLITVDMPNVETIGESVFQECASLTKVYMPNVETIGKSAFQDCLILTTVTMPRVAFGNDAFLNTNVLLPELTCRNVTRDCFSEKTCRDVGPRFEHNDGHVLPVTQCVPPFLQTPSCLNGTDSSKNCLNSFSSSLEKMTTIPPSLAGNKMPTWANKSLDLQVDYLNTILHSREFEKIFCLNPNPNMHRAFCPIVNTYESCSVWDSSRSITNALECSFSLGQICNTTINDRPDICKCEAIVTYNSSGDNSDFKGSVGSWFDISQNILGHHEVKEMIEFIRKNPSYNHSNSTFDPTYISSIECHSKSCVEGTYNSSGSCLPCDAGKYSDQTAQPSCKDCPKGKYGDLDGLSVCHDCGTGKYNEQTAQPSCKDCDAGKYNEQVGQESTGCKNCDVTKTTLNPGSSNASDCKTGTILRGEFINRPEKILTHNDLRVAYKRLNQCS